MTVRDEEAIEQRALSADEISELARRYTLYDWMSQSQANPIAVSHAKGVYFYAVDGRRYLDFNSQLMSVNIGHGDPRVVAAITEQAAKLAYVSPFMATEARARLGERLAGLLPGDIDKVFFTLGGAEANENAIRMARLYTGRHKVIAQYRSYHGATAGAITLTGDPRRWANEPGIPGVIHVLNPYHGVGSETDSADRALGTLTETIELEGPETIAAIILEPVVGTNGILIPPPGFLPGVREVCDRFGIQMIADEIMTGFGRTGEWFAVNHWNVVPDLITMAKGLTSSYVPMGAVGLRHHVAEYFNDHVFAGGLTYNSHPVGCAAALATLDVYENDRLIDNARNQGELLKELHAEMARRHASVGAHRSIGLFGILELVRNRETMEPMAAFNSNSAAMQAVNRYLLDHGLYTMIRWNSIMTNPPLSITSDELREGMAIVDGALNVADQYVAM